MSKANENDNASTTNILNLSAFDPFQQGSGDSDASGRVLTEDGKVHIRLRQRNARKTICTVEGLEQSIDFERVLRHLKKTLCCNGIVIDDKTLGKVLQLQGDHRKEIAQFIVDEELVASADVVKIHGYN